MGEADAAVPRPEAGYARELAYLREPGVELTDEDIYGAVDVLLTVRYDVLRHYPAEPGQGWEVN